MRIYDLLLHLYPRSFRHEYGDGLTQVVADPEALRLVPQDFARRNRILPSAFHLQDEVLTVATTEIFTVVAMDQLRAMLLDVAGARREQGHLRGPHGLLQGEERAHAAGLVRLDRERGHLAHEIDPLLPERRNHVGEVDLDDVVVALLLHAVVKHDLADRHVVNDASPQGRYLLAHR